MKQILFLALALLPCLAWAQYPSNGNQKITLGEQTTADGLIWRGVAADTTLTAKSDTAAYFVLDTANLNLYTYKASASGKKWIQLGSDTTSLNLVSRFAAKLNISDTASMLTPYIERGDTASMLTPYWRSGRFSGVLPVANGGTNTSTAFTAGSIVFAGSGGTYTQSNSGLFYRDDFKFLGVGTNNPLLNVHINSLTGSNSTVAFSENNTLKWYFRYNAGNGHFQFVDVVNLTTRMQLNNDGKVGMGTVEPTQALHVVGNGRFTEVGAGTFSNNLNITSDGTLTTATSDEKFKYNIRPLNYGLSTLLQLKPVNFQWINGEDEDLGFIAQDVAEIIPEAVNTNWNSDLLFRYESLIPILTKAIQEQNLLIKALEQRIINLENK